MYLPYLKFSDWLPETHLLFYLGGWYHAVSANDFIFRSNRSNKG